MRALITALRMLTVIPVPGRESDTMSSALPFFPIVGGIIGAVLFGIAYAAGTVLAIDWPEGIAVILLAAGTLLTGGLHLDGIADWGDSLGCTYDREKMLRVMKDSRNGTFGVLALILVLLAKWAAMARLLAFDNAILIMIAPIISRTVMAGLAVWLPYARPEGGTGGDIVTGARTSHLYGAYGICIALVVFLAGLEGVFCLAGGMLVSFLLGIWSRRKIGGVTGDILGACSELAETAVLLAGAAFLVS